MTIADYVKSHLHTDEPLPFPTQVVLLKKGSEITTVGQIEQRVYFLQRGMTEASIIKDDDHERIVDFFFDHNFFSSYTSFITQQPSNVRITCLTDCQLEIIERADLLHAYGTSLLANRLGRYITEQAYMAKTQREKDFLTKTAEQRYLDLIHNRADIIHQIPIHKIAKYLGIHPESLSRLRKSIIS